MANEIVKYDNTMNDVSFRKFTPNELDLFFSICSKMKEKGTQTIRFEFEQLRELSQYKPTATKRFVEDLNRTYTKMLTLTYGEQNGLDIKRFVLFTGFHINGNEQYVDVTTNSNLENILNELSNQFTRFELEEFTELKSSYSKSLYRKLKQFKSTGIYLVNMEEFKRLLDIPVSYQMGNIDQKILKPVYKELNSLFDNLKITKIKAKKGNKIAQLQFTFKEKNRTQVPLHDWVKKDE